ncbi:MAG: alpha/beta hydrolase [Planctomycetota bacterium]
MEEPLRPRTSTPAWRRAARTARWLLAAYLIVVLGMTMIERWLVYPAPPRPSADTAAPEDAETVWIDVPPARGGGEPTRVHGWLFPAPGGEPCRRAVLFCHGNGEDVTNLPPIARTLRDTLDAAVLVFDYRGYGMSDGKPHEAGVVADTRAAQRFLAERCGVDTDRVVLFGRSLGGAAAIAAAADDGAAALVAQCTFTRLTDAAASHYPWLPVHWVMRNRFDSVARITAYTGPVWVCHGTADEVVPFEQGRRLYEAATGPKRFVELPGVRHDAGRPTSYYRELRRFLDERAAGWGPETADPGLAAASSEIDAASPAD